MTEKRKRGRPLKVAQPGERVSLGLKVTGDIKARIDAAAKASGRTQSQEAELRLEQSFHDQALLHGVLELAFGKQLAGILLTIGATMDQAGRHAAFTETRTLEGSVAWLDNAHGYDEAVGAARWILEGLRPEGDPTPTSRASDIVVLENLGAGMADMRLQALKGKRTTGTLYEWATPVRALLGPLAQRIGAIATPVRVHRKGGKK